MTETRTLNANELDALRKSVEGSIRKAFAHCRRAGGVSWSEADVIDDYGTAEQRAKARARDTDTAWDQLVDDPRWNAHENSANFTFLDSIGKRYYLPAIMIRAMQQRRALDLAFSLGAPFSHELNDAQVRAVARYIYFMWQKERTEAHENQVDVCISQWGDLLALGWRGYLNEPNL